jgi:hypothetical protein
MENFAHLQCKALRSREKRRGAKNNGKQWENNAKNNGNNAGSGRMPTFGCNAGRQAMSLRARGGQNAFTEIPGLSGFVLRGRRCAGPKPRATMMPRECPR